jgi:hypothetical protein
MSDRVIIDMSRVEEALKLSSHEREVVIERERAKNRSRLIKYSAMGCALVIVSIGLAFWLGRQWHNYVSAPKNIVTKLLQSDQQSGKDPNKVVTNVVLFNSIGKVVMSPEFFNPYFVSIFAGHRYSTSNADTWEQAWCYADFEKERMKFKIDLAIYDKLDFFPVPATQRELRELALTDADVVFLRSRCPWRSR